MPRLRIRADASIPEFHEELALRGPWRAAGRLLGAAGLLGGLWLVATTDGRSAETYGPLICVVGGALLVLVIRCRRHETTVGTVRLELVLGPFRRMMPTGATTAIECRPARGWRALYAADELVLVSSAEDRRRVVPSARPQALIEAIERQHLD